MLLAAEVRGICARLIRLSGSTQANNAGVSPIIAPSPQQIVVQNLGLIGEQDGPPERQLKVFNLAFRGGAHIDAWWAWRGTSTSSSHSIPVLQRVREVRSGGLPIWD